MSRAKTERLLNLVICLLASPRYLSREEIRRAVPGYADSDYAFERAFERDKDELREMGIPIETGSNDAWFEDEVGYRIRRDNYALPEVSFTGDEMAVLALAARAWQQAAFAGAASSALLKLQAYGVETSELRISGIEPRVDTNEASFRPLWEAVRDAMPVSFEYRRAGAGPHEKRTVEPWGVVSWHGRWYLVGHDRDRHATRVFRLSRIESDVVSAGSPGEVTVPPGVDIRAAVMQFEGPAHRSTAVVRARTGTGGYLRRWAARVTPDADGWDRLEVPFSDARQFAENVSAFGADVVVLEPSEVRDEVVRRMRRILEVTGA